MYCAFIFSFTELTTAIRTLAALSPTPTAPSAHRRLYRCFATLIEFVFAPPPSPWPSGLLNVQFRRWIRNGCRRLRDLYDAQYLGVGIAATFELIVTLLAIFELLVFMGVVAPGFSRSHFTTNGWAGADSGPALPGMFAAIPFAIWPRH